MNAADMTMNSSSSSSVTHKQSVIERALNVRHRDTPSQSQPLHMTDATFDPKDVRVKEDIIRIIVQYLKGEGFSTTSAVLQDEAKLKLDACVALHSKAQRMIAALKEGNWSEVEKLCTKQLLKNFKVFQYAVYKQQFLEQVESNASQKAFNTLTRRIKPMEHLAPVAEFRDLCYLLACRNVTKANSFKNWDGVSAARDRLVEQFRSMLDLDNTAAATAASNKGGSSAASTYVPEDRLITLLHQAVAFQIESGRYHPKVPPRIETLLKDFESFVLPNRQRSVLRVHTANVKCVQFVGEDGLSLASGSSDNTVRIWNVETSGLVHTLRGHTSRIWNLASTISGSHIASASADGTLRIWDLGDDYCSHSSGGGGVDSSRCISSLKISPTDVYAVRYHPCEDHVVTGGYDKQVRLSDLRTGQVVTAFSGHELTVSGVAFNPHGNLTISGSKDCTVKFWDIVSGLCIKTISSDLGEVTSLEVDSTGMYLLLATKDNSNRLWDVRMQRPLRRFGGHQNTSKNFVRAAWGPGEDMIIGGSEDGRVHLWDRSTGENLQRLPGHENGIVYSAVWNARQSLLASCGEDGTVRTWDYNDQEELFIGD